jgi:protein-S-isoprenylcysteine O-methyltransferase Ste14
MALSDEFQKQGEWLFRWRGYLPLLFIILLSIALRNYEWPFPSYLDYVIWARLCFGVSVMGLAIRCITVGYAPAGTSGRNTKRQVARQLNTAGLYSLIRHPLYLGNFLIGLGVSCAPAVWWLPVSYCVMFCAYYERIMFAEEAFLRRKFGHKFDRWAARTPAFIPRTVRWRKPALPFSFRNVLRREYTGLMVVILGNAGVQFTEHLIIDHRVVYEMFWVDLLIGGSAAYFLLQSLKKRTTLLNVPGR